MAEPIRIDASLGEGGGQVLRSALSLALLSGRAIELEHIRASRPRPGLRPQHLQAVQAAARLCGGRLEGARLGAQSIRLSPGIVAGPGDTELAFDIGTAGSTCLLLQTLSLPLAFATPAGATARLRLDGGTHVPWSPCYHYLDRQWRPALAAMGLGLKLRLARAGFHPEGGGRLQAAIPGIARLAALERTGRGRLLRVAGVSAVANLDEDIAGRQRRRALAGLRALGVPCEITIERLPAVSRGTLLLVQAQFEHADLCAFALGARGRRAEAVAEEAVAALLDQVRRPGAVDPWMADQLLLPLALAEGGSRLTTTEVTAHLLTNAEVIRRFLPVGIGIRGAPGEPGELRVRGVGLSGRAMQSAQASTAPLAPP